MKKVLIFTTNMGHKSIADACNQAFAKNGWKTNIFSSIFAEAKLVYEPIYKLAPFLNKIYFKAGTSKKTPRKFEKGFSNRKIFQTKKIIKNFKPDLIVSTYPGYNPAIGKIKKKQKIPFINIICNPITFHPLEVSPSAEINAVYSQKTKKAVSRLDIEPKNIKILGWLTRENFYEKGSKKRQKKLTILFCAGSLGVQNVIKFLPSFNKAKKPLKIIMIAGKNNFLFKAFKTYKKINWLLEKFAINHLDISVYQFTENMPALIKQSDIVIGKAGPNLIFEAVASKKPFIAISYIPGQENGNLEIIKEKKLGWVALEPKEFEILIKKIVNNPKMLKKIAKNIAKERKTNYTAGDKLVRIANRLIKGQEKNL